MFSNIQEAYIVRASDVAKLASKEVPKGSEERLLFGKAFENAFTWPEVPKSLKEFELRLKLELEKISLPPRYLKEGLDIAAALLKKKYVKGKKPRTLFRVLDGNLVIAAQPDLFYTKGTVFKGTKKFIEIKLYPVGDFAILHTEIFAWVVGAQRDGFWKETILLGVKKTKSGIWLQKREIYPSFPKVNKQDLIKIARKQLFCFNCMQPASRCNCLNPDDFYDGFY